MQLNRFKTTRIVSHSAEKMFDIVADVEKYPLFVPLCEKLVIKDRSADDGKEILTADMTVSFKLIRETYTSKVTLEPEGQRIMVTYLSGPFRHLDNRWSFRPKTDTSCYVDFFIAYEFKNAALQIVMGSMFDQAFRKFSEAFEKRADQVYS